MRHLRPAALALLLVATATASACSARPEPSSPASPAGNALPVPGATASGPTGRLDIGSTGESGAAASVRYVRVETTEPRTVLEKDFRDGPVTLDQSLPPGTYRVLTWRRGCTGGCPETGDQGLGTPEDICGAKVQVLAGTAVRATIVLSPDADCTVRSVGDG
ncbi:hypothetical protein ACIQWA_06800 [Kitasatospora sp. NPDC098652]|uniref:hypothetical protein n=1 Tax=Kitasatospora sp. NPDC098652 TaxID=3364095 RepID=UPI00380BF41B